MNINNFLRSCLVSINGFLLSISLAHAVIPINDLTSCDVALKPGYEYMSPALGYFLYNAGLIENLRFSEFVESCDDGNRLNDKSNDPLVSIVISLFPSSTGLVLPTDNIDDPTEIAALLNAVFYLRSSEKQDVCSLDVGKQGATCKKHGNHLEAACDNFLCKKYYDALQQLKRTNIKKSFKTNIIFYYQLEQTGLYPKFLLEEIIWAYAITRFNSKEDLDLILKNLDHEVIEVNNIDSKLDSSIITHGSRLQQINDILSNNSLVPYTSASDVIPHGHVNFFDRNIGKINEEFQYEDCGETVIRHFFNLALYNSESRSFDLQYVKKIYDNLPDDEHKSKHPLNYLINFYETHDVKSCISGTSMDIRNAWNKVVGNIQGIQYTDRNHYNDHGIIPTDENVVKAISIVLNIEMDCRRISKQQYAEILTTINPETNVKIEEGWPSNLMEYTSQAYKHYCLTVCNQPVIFFRTSSSHADAIGAKFKNDKLRNITEEYFKNKASDTLAFYLFRQYSWGLIDSLHPFYLFFSQNKQQRSISSDSMKLLKCINWNMRTGCLPERITKGIIIPVLKSSDLKSYSQILAYVLKLFLTQHKSKSSKKAIRLIFESAWRNLEQIVPDELKESSLNQALHNFNVLNDTDCSFGHLTIDINTFLKEKNTVSQKNSNPYRNIKSLELHGTLLEDSTNLERTIDLSMFKNLNELVLNTNSNNYECLIFKGKCDTLKEIRLMNPNVKCFFRDLNNSTMHVKMTYLMNSHMPLSNCHFTITGLSNITDLSSTLELVSLPGNGVINMEDLPLFIKNAKLNELRLFVHAVVPRIAFNFYTKSVDPLNIKKMYLFGSNIAEVSGLSFINNLQEMTLYENNAYDQKNIVYTQLDELPSSLKIINVRKHMYDNNSTIQEALNKSYLTQVAVKRYPVLNPNEVKILHLQN